MAVVVFWHDAVGPASQKASRFVQERWLIGLSPAIRTFDAAKVLS